MSPAPYLEYQALCLLAEDFGLVPSQYESIEIFDEAALKTAGMMRQSPDYPRIRKALREGAIVPGARLSGVAYKLLRVSQHSTEGG